MASPTINRTVESRLKERDVRYTAGRRTVIEALAAADGPLSASELHAEVDTLPLSSLYRSLSTLEAAGVIEPHNAVRGVTRYELSEWLRGHHHHLICTQCGSVDDVTVDAEQEQQVEQLVAAIGANAGFSPTGHSFEIEGHCARCS